MVKLVYRNYVDFVGLEEEGGPGGDEGLRIWRRGRCWLFLLVEGRRG